MRCPTLTHCDLKEQRGMREQLTGESSCAQLPEQVLCQCCNYTALIGRSSEFITLLFAVKGKTSSACLLPVLAGTQR